MCFFPLRGRGIHLNECRNVWCCCCAAIQFLIRNLLLQLRTTSSSHFKEWQYHLMIFLVFTFFEFAVRAHMSAPITTAAPAVAFIYPRWYAVSRAFCYAMRMMISLFLSSSGKLNGGRHGYGCRPESSCFLHAYVRVRQKRVWMCVCVCNCADAGMRRKWWCVIRYEVCCVWVLGIISIFERNEMKWNRRQKRKHGNIQRNR